MGADTKTRHDDEHTRIAHLLSSLVFMCIYMLGICIDVSGRFRSGTFGATLYDP